MDKKDEIDKIVLLNKHASQKARNENQSVLQKLINMQERNST